eukprot:Phypoly_transcript_13998.p1 GENE.Phypoly_transcript_13998~~Phypoly_transcript_13998.p1  ORF type:complete len:170 (+),score=19.55 Phypoly_transcript_13998:441-950(+)
MYDVANESSFQKAADLISFIDSYHSVHEKCVIVIANNCGTAKRIVSAQDGINLALKWKARYIETDAISGNNVESVFWTFASDFCARMFSPKNRRPTSNGSMKFITSLASSLASPTSSPSISPFRLVESGELIQTEDDFRAATLDQEKAPPISESSRLLGAKKRSRCSCW